LIVFTFGDILLLEEVQEHIYTINRIIELESMQAVSKQIKKKSLDLAFSLRENKMLKLKLSL
jgi:hypothetical protein